MKQEEAARLWPCPQLFLYVLSFTLSFIRRLPILHPFNWLQMPTGLPLMGMVRVGQQVLCWSCCKVLMKALDGCPNLPWGSAPPCQEALGKFSGDPARSYHRSLMEGMGYQPYAKQPHCHVVGRFLFFSLWTAVCTLVFPTPPPHSFPVVTTLGTNEGPVLRTPGTDVTPHLSHVSSFSSPCFLFPTSIASLFCSMTF